MINKELVKDLDEDILLQAIAIFIKNAENDLGGLQLAFDRSNTPQVKRISHKLAGNLKTGRSYHYKRDYIDKFEPFLTEKCESYFNTLIDN